MLKIRTIILSGILAVFLVLTVQMVTAGADSVSEPEKGTGNGAESQEMSTVSKKTYNSLEYRSQFGECSDVSMPNSLPAALKASSLPKPFWMNVSIYC